MRHHLPFQVGIGVLGDGVAGQEVVDAAVVVRATLSVKLQRLVGGKTLGVTRFAPANAKLQVIEGIGLGEEILVGNRPAARNRGEQTPFVVLTKLRATIVAQRTCDIVLVVQVHRSAAKEGGQRSAVLVRASVAAAGQNQRSGTQAQVVVSQAGSYELTVIGTKTIVDDILIGIAGQQREVAAPLPESFEVVGGKFQ